MGNPLADRLRARRLELGLSVEEAAHQAGLAVDLFHAVEAGKRQPDLDHLPYLAAALGLDASDLCRLTLESSWPIFYAALIGRPPTDELPWLEVLDRALVEVRQEDVGWLRQFYDLDSQTRRNVRGMVEVLLVGTAIRAD